MARHPGNTNLHLYPYDTFDGFRIMIDKGPFIEEHLFRLKRTIELALDHYPRVLAVRVDLRLPDDFSMFDQSCSNEVISRFFDSFKAKIEHNRDRARVRSKAAHDTKVRYVWVREVGMKGRPHYHVLILFNRDAFNKIGRLKSQADNTFNRLQGAWASALRQSNDQVKGLVEIPPNAEYWIDRHVAFEEEDQLPALFYRASYLCKSATKSFGDWKHSFGSSRG